MARNEQKLWAVADGMGGHDAGEVASRMIVEALSRVPESSSLSTFERDAIAAVKEVNQALIELSHNQHQERTIGSTVVGLIADKTKYRCFWVGDSRAYLVRGGAIARITRDHSLVQDLVDAGMLDPADAESHPNSNVITRAVGASETVAVDTASGEILPDDTFLLASDGLTRLVKDEELLAVIESNSITSASNRLLEMALERGAPDNVSLIILRAD